jgi:transcriptional regulator with XRE-family HTH domain
MNRKRENEPAASLIAFFGTELRRRRKATGLSVDHLAPELHASASLVGKVENGDRVPQPDLGKACDQFFGLDMFEQAALAIKEQFRAYPSGFPDFLDEEAKASCVEEWDVLQIPGLLQTEDYARASFRGGRPRDTEEQIEQITSSRLERQGIFDRDKPPMAWFAIGEGALRQEVGGPAVMAAQLAQVIEMGQRPGIVVQVVPFKKGAHAGLLGTFTLLTRPDGMKVAYTESVASSQLIERPEDVAEFVLAYDTLRIEALTPDASRAFIREIKEAFENEAKSG